jgi:hypothetical protein
MLNNCHTRACGGNLSRLATTQKILRALLLLADTNQRLYRIGHEVPPVSNLLSKNEYTSYSHVSYHHS